MTDESTPIFVRGISRSGGTLVATLLDAHPDIAMSYELYPNLLDSADGSVAFVSALADRLETARSLEEFARSISADGLRVFMLRIPRGGITKERLVSLLREHASSGMGFATPVERLRFLERCCVAKARSVGKKRWGVKSTSAFSEYLSVWPHAYLVNVVRDGRDVLASTLRTGAFKKTPESLGRAWSRTHLAFRHLVRDSDVRAYELRYEDLVSDPTAESRRLCAFLDLPFDDEMLRFHEQPLTIYGTRHLSIERLRKPIDPSKIGRWRFELSSEQLDAFYSSARDAMIELEYLER